jgi:hypothetical protein
MAFDSKQYNKKYYQEHRAELLEQKRQYYQSHKKECAERRRQYDLEHPELANSYRKWHPAYPVWCNMKHRCLNSNNIGYKDYGGRGIGICKEWLDFKAFELWLYENGWQPGLTVDRIDSDGNYEPNNVQFITLAENACKELRKPVNQYDLEGNFIATYPSTIEAHRQTGIYVSGACRGKFKQAGGFIWKYA